MNAPADRIGAALRVGPNFAWLMIVAGLVGSAALAAGATRLGILPIVLGAVLVGIMALVGLRWPLLPLLLFAALIPIEEVVVFEGFGTIGRFAGILFAVTYAGSKLGRIDFRVMPLAAWAYLVWSMASLTWAIDPSVAWTQLVTLVQLFLIAVLIGDFVVERPTIVRPVLWVYTASATVTAVIGIQTYLAQGLVDARAAALQDQNPAQFAAVLLPALVFGLYELMNGQRRLLSGAITAITAVGVLVSGTRGAWVAVVVVVALLVLPQLPRRRRVVAVALAVALAVGMYQLPGVPDLLAERTGTAVSTGGAGRTDIWSVAGRIYATAPVLGVGYNNFPVSYTPDLVRSANVTSLVLAGRGPHNVVVGTLIELGPIGLFLLLLFVLPLVRRRGWGPDAATVQAALASMLTLALFLDIIGNRKQVWLVIGFAVGLTYLAERRKRGAPAVGDRVPDGPGAELPTRPARLLRGPDVANPPARH